MFGLVLTALFKKSISPDRWYVASKPPNTLIVTSNKLTSLLIVNTKLSSTHFLALVYSGTLRKKTHFSLATNEYSHSFQVKFLYAPSYNPIIYIVSNESTIVRPKPNHSWYLFDIGLTLSWPHAYFLYPFQECLNAATTASCLLFCGPKSASVTTNVAI